MQRLGSQGAVADWHADNYEDCLRMMVLPTMQRVIEKVNFTLSYIGT